MIYLAFPIDYSAVDHAAEPLLLESWKVYCPACEAVPGEPDWQRLDRNERALYAADRVLAIFVGQSFGVPVEVWIKSRTDPAAVVLVHPDEPGLYVRELERIGVTVVATLETAVEWIASEAVNVD